MTNLAKPSQYYPPQHGKLTSRIPENIPLITIPRLLLNSTRTEVLSGIHVSSFSSQPLNIYRPPSNEHEDSFQEIERLNSLSILDFPPELIASSIVDLWKDLESDKSREDFLQYQRGWIGHAVLLGCYNSTGTRVIERVIEVACCLDLLCQTHHIAVAVIQSIQSSAVSRMTAWQQIRPPLIHKMKEILDGSLAADIHPANVFHTTRDASLEYWILSRPYVDDGHLLAESLAVEPENNDANDVETRITQLEALLLTLNPESITSHGLSSDVLDTEVCEQGFSDMDQLTETETETDTASSVVCSSDTESTDNDEGDPIHKVAKQTRARLSQRLEFLKNSVHIKSESIEPASLDVGQLSVHLTETSTRLINPFDQRAIFRARSQVEKRSVPRGLCPTVTHSNNPTNRRSLKPTNIIDSLSGKQTEETRAALRRRG
jgi:hypothetical protein